MRAYPTLTKMSLSDEFPLMDEPVLWHYDTGETEEDDWVHLCPVCMAHQKCWKASGDFEKSDKCPSHHSFPHVAFECGGMYREVEVGVWKGHCGAKLKQQRLAFVEEP